MIEIVQLKQYYSLNVCKQVSDWEQETPCFDVKNEVFDGNDERILDRYQVHCGQHAKRLDDLHQVLIILSCFCYYIMN